MLSPGDKLGRYDILEVAGAGGMGTVYRARDAVLHRDVAVKTLSGTDLERPDRKQRFVQEARAASSLNHPNIITIYDIGNEQGIDFIAMEFVQGQTLDKLVGASGMFPLDVVRYASQIASALSAAHSAGIVHRDLKPNNVMVTEAGLVKVLDFGLAKLTDRNPVSNTDVTVTGVASPTIEGTVLGTVAYMSPEQAESKAIDARSDIFSFGSVLYEAITGKRAFQGDSGLSTMAAILRDNPVPPSRVAREVSPQLEQIVHRCLEKDPDRRYQRMSDVKAALDSISGVQAYSGSTTGIHPPAMPCAASIAVLPFSNLSADKENEYFSDGLAEELINALAKVKGLRVTARTSAFAFRDKDQDVRTIAKVLNVETVLEGSVRKSGNRVRITTQLIKASDGYHLWSERYDRELTDIFAIQDEISAAIVDALCDHLGLRMTQPEKKAHTPNLEAYNALLLSRYHRFRFTPESFMLARRFAEQAVQLDPEYAEAHTNLAMVNVAEWALDVSDAGKCITAAQSSLKRAMTLDPAMGTAHAILGTIHAAHDYDWTAAEQDFARALKLSPNAADVLTQYGYWFLRPYGRLREAREHYRRVLEIDPLSTFALFTLAESYLFESRFDSVIEYSLKALEIDPNYWPPASLIASAYAFQGRCKEAQEWSARCLALMPGDTNVRCLAASVHAACGDLEPARGLVAELEPRTGFARVPIMLAMMYYCTGDIDGVFRCADEMIANHSARVFWLLSPNYHALQSDPRFVDVVRRLHLPLDTITARFSAS